jgi:hypothetical protein
MNFPLEPNRDLIMPHGWDMGFLIFAGSVLTLFVLYGLYLLLVKKEPLLLFCLAGGLMGEMLEPICDLLGMAYHPEHGQMVGFVTLGRQIPLWLVLCYPWYFGAFAYRLITWDARGELTAQRFWATLGVAVFFCFAIEIGPVQVVLWDYFGEQPLTLFAKPGVTHGMPLMWYIVNPTSVVAVASFLALATRNLSGWQRWTVLALMPVSIVGFHTGAFAPVYVTENAGWTASQSLLSAAVSTVFCAVLLKVFERMLLGSRATSEVRQGASIKGGAEVVRGGKPA